METRANVIAIGIFVLVMFGMALGTVYWLATAGDATDETELIVVFEGAVTGLTKSAAVYFNGIKIGNVSAIKFSKNDPTRVLAYATVDATAPLKTDTVAELGFQGLTGVAYIELKGGSINADRLFAAEGTPTIVANPSAFQDILATARQVLTKVDETMVDIRAILKDSRGPFIKTVTNVERVTDAVADNADNIATFLDDMSTAGKSFASLSAELELLAGKVGPIVDSIEPETVRTILKDASDLTARLAQAAGKVETIIASAEQAANEVKSFAVGLNASLGKVDGLLDAVDRQKVANTIDGLEAITGAFKDKKEDLTGLITDARSAAANLNTVTGKLAARADDIEGIVVDARTAVRNAGTLTETLAEASSGAAKVVEAIDPEAIRRTVDSVDAVTSRLAARSDSIDKIIGDAEAALGDARVAVANVRTVSETLNARNEDIDAMVIDARAAIRNAGTLTETLNTAAADASRLIAAVDADAVKRTVGNVDQVTSRLALRSDTIDKILFDTEAALAEARVAAGNVKDFTGSLNARTDSVDRIITNVEAATGDFPAISTEIKAALAEVKALAAAVEADKINQAVTNIAGLTGRLAERGDDIDAIVTGARKSTDNLQSFTDSLSSKSGEVEKIVDQALVLAKRLNATSVRIDALIKKVDGVVGDAETGGLISEAKRAATSIANIAQVFESRAGRISQGMDRLTTTGVSKFEALLETGQRALRQIEQSVQNLERNPQSLILGGPKPRQFDGNRR